MVSLYVRCALVALSAEVLHVRRCIEWVLASVRSQMLSERQQLALAKHIVTQLQQQAASLRLISPLALQLQHQQLCVQFRVYLFLYDTI